jgi:hypothetical protein
MKRHESEDNGEDGSIDTPQMKEDYRPVVIESMAEVPIALFRDDDNAALNNKDEDDELDIEIK